LKLLPPDKGGEGKVGEKRRENGKGGKRNEGERMGKELPSIPTVPNLPLQR